MATNDPALPNSAPLSEAAADSLGDEIATLCSCLYAAEARLLEYLHRFDSQGGYRALGFHSTAQWLNYRCGFGMNAAREKVRVANAVAGLPVLREQFSLGRLSYSKLRALTRIATPETEDYLWMIARHGTAHHVEKLVALTRRVQSAREAANAEAVYSGRELVARFDASGALVIRGRFPAEQGLVILRALERAMDAAFGAASKDRDDTRIDTNAVREADAASCTDEASGGADVAAVTSEPVAIAARRADALAAVAETYLNHPENSGSTADRYQVMVHVSAETLYGGVAAETLDGDHTNSPADEVTAVTRSPGHGIDAFEADRPDSAPYLDDGPGVTVEAARRLACDGSTVPVLETPLGEPLSIGRRSRTIPPAIRRALKLRDGGCRFPGCTHTRFVDGHHIIHWAAGGETSLDNLVLLCRQHHRLVHEGGFGCERKPDGEIVFTDRRHRSLPDAPALPGFGDDLNAWIRRQILRLGIDAHSCRARLNGVERVDWGQAVSPLV